MGLVRRRVTRRLTTPQIVCLCGNHLRHSCTVMYDHFIIEVVFCKEGNTLVRQLLSLITVYFICLCVAHEETVSFETKETLCESHYFHYNFR